MNEVLKEYIKPAIGWRTPSKKYARARYEFIHDEVTQSVNFDWNVDTPSEVHVHISGVLIAIVHHELNSAIREQIANAMMDFKIERPFFLLVDTLHEASIDCTVERNTFDGIAGEKSVSEYLSLKDRLRW